MRVFGEVLRTRREELGLGRRALLGRAMERAPSVRGLQPYALLRWERGEARPDAGQLAALGAALGWSDEEIGAAARLAAELDPESGPDAEGEAA